MKILALVGLLSLLAGWTWLIASIIREWDNQDKQIATLVASRWKRVAEPPKGDAGPQRGER